MNKNKLMILRFDLLFSLNKIHCISIFKIIKMISYIFLISKFVFCKAKIFNLNLDF